MEVQQEPSDVVSLFLEPWDWSDVAFLVESRLIYANRSVMSMWSPVMKAMLNGDFREKTADVIELPEKSFDDFLELVSVLHPPNKDINGDNVAGLLHLAREYQILDLSRRCEAFLLTQSASVRGLMMAEQYDLKNLEAHCSKYVDRSTLKRLMSEDGFDQLSDVTRSKIVLNKGKMYEDVLSRIFDIVNGKRPSRFLGSCPNQSQEGAHGHNSGTKRSCGTCAVNMTSRVASLLDNMKTKL